MSQRGYEGICGVNEFVFIPRGWWHAVINIEDYTLAVTENFVTRSILPTVRRFLRAKPDQISGLPCEMREDLARIFDECLEKDGEVLTPMENHPSLKRPNGDNNEAVGGRRKKIGWKRKKAE